MPQEATVRSVAQAYRDHSPDLAETFQWKKQNGRFERYTDLFEEMLPKDIIVALTKERLPPFDDVTRKTE